MAMGKPNDFGTEPDDRTHKWSHLPSAHSRRDASTPIYAHHPRPDLAVRADNRILVILVDVLANMGLDLNGHARR